jgi:regulator of protease activity HflC (stomatin/prohibitin superfamily)
MTYRIVDPMKVIYEIYDLSQAMERLVQTTLRGLVGSMGLDDALASRSELTRSLLARISRECLGWGVEVISVHLLEINPNESIQHAMHSQISSERRRRAGVVEAQGYRESVKLETEGQSFSAVVLAKARARVMELEALGNAQSRVTLAKAEAEALNIMRSVLEGCGVDAAQYQIGDKYLTSLAAVLKSGSVSVTMPMQTDVVGCTRLLSQE